MTEQQATDRAYLRENLRAVTAALEQAAAAAGRTDVPRMVAAVKYAEDAELRELLRLGVGEVGENRVQQLLAHWPLYESTDVQVHFIGHLQKNKVKYIVDKVALIHSVDSAELAEEISRRAVAKGLTVSVLVEINSGREAAKSGVLPEEAEALCRAILALPGLALQGFMTMAPRCEDAAAYRTYFAETRRLAKALWQRLALPGAPLLSMGMSESFEAAVAEGADIVRVGRRLFAGRPL